jgi:hypothetical protein
VSASLFITIALKNKNAYLNIETKQNNVNNHSKFVLSLFRGALNKLIFALPKNALFHSQKKVQSFFAI